MYILTEAVTSGTALHEAFQFKNISEVTVSRDLETAM